LEIYAGKSIRELNLTPLWMQFFDILNDAWGHQDNQALTTPLPPNYEFSESW